MDNLRFLFALEESVAQRNKNGENEAEVDETYLQRDNEYIYESIRVLVPHDNDDNNTVL